MAYFAPFAESVVKSNIFHEESSREWADANVDTNQMLSDLNGRLAGLIEAAGYHASNLPPTYNYDEVNLRSDWSHRSAAVIRSLSGNDTCGKCMVAVPCSMKAPRLASENSSPVE